MPISLRFILILSSHLCLGLPKSLFPVGVPVKILKALLPSSILAIWPAHLNLPDLITQRMLGERCQLWSSSLWSLLHFPFSSLLDPNIRLRILFSNTLDLHSSFYTCVKFNISPKHICSVIRLSNGDAKLSDILMFFNGLANVGTEFFFHRSFPHKLYYSETLSYTHSWQLHIFIDTHHPAV